MTQETLDARMMLTYYTCSKLRERTFQLNILLPSFLPYTSLHSDRVLDLMEYMGAATISFLRNQ